MLAAVELPAGAIPVFVWQTTGRFVTPPEAREAPLLVAAANWHALATFVGRLAPEGSALLIDVGTTTTDLIPLKDGVPIPVGRTDRERLQSGELVYSGVKRTPVCALVRDSSLSGPGLSAGRRAFRDDARRLPRAGRSSGESARHGDGRRPPGDDRRGPRSAGPLSLLRRNGILCGGHAVMSQSIAQAQRRQIARGIDAVLAAQGCAPGAARDFRAPEASWPSKRSQRSAVWPRRRRSGWPTDSARRLPKRPAHLRWPAWPSNAASPAASFRLNLAADKMTSPSKEQTMPTTDLLLLPMRRRFLQSAAFGTALFTVRGLFAEELVRTPRQTEGPFYPDHLPLDTDNDLIIVNDSITPAVGEITHLSGRLLDPLGKPVKDCARRNLAGRPQRRLPAFAQQQSRQARPELPGLRPLSDRFERRILFPDGQAGRLSGTHAPHPLRRQDEAAVEVHDAVLHQG